MGIGLEGNADHGGGGLVAEDDEPEVAGAAADSDCDEEPVAGALGRPAGLALGKKLGRHFLRLQHRRRRRQR